MTKNPLLPDPWDVPTRFHERLGSTVGRQRAMVHEGHLLLVLHSPPEPDQEDRSGRFFWRDPNGKWESDQFGSGSESVIRHLDGFHERLDRLDKQEEDADSSQDYFEVLEALAPLQRAARNLHSVLQEARDQCPDAREIIDLRDRAYRLERNADLLATGAKHGLDFRMARKSEQQSRASERMAASAHRLNLLAAFFLPLATLCGIFSMDLPSSLSTIPYLGDVPESLLFAAIVLVGLTLGILLMLLVRIRKSEPSTD